MKIDSWFFRSFVMATQFRIQAVALSAAFSISVLSFPAIAADQFCNPSNISLSSQLEVDNFQAVYGPCDTIGTLIISGDDITSLAGLAGLARVGGTLLEISGNNRLENLDGLESLTTIAGDLRINDNSALINIDGLSSLSMVTIDPVYKIEISRNAALRNLDGLSSLTGLAGALIIHLNGSLSNVHGLSNLEQVGAILHIAANHTLTELNGLENLTSVGALGIVNNASLADISGLSSLETVVLWFEILWNPMLADCQGIVRLIDPIDDYEPGPGPGVAGIPDIGDYAIIENNSEKCESVNAILGDVPLAEINPGLNDAWFNPETAGQGFLITAFPEIRQLFMAWFTYDTERPPADVTALLGEPGHRWLTAQGVYEDNFAWLNIHVTSGGVFDSPEPRPVTGPIGEVTLEFSTCNAGTITYDIPSIGRQHVIPIERIVLDNVSQCYLLGKKQAATE
jgi:hypothetical protein